MNDLERLTLLYRLSQAFNSSLDLQEVLRTVMDEVVTATRAERGFLMLVDQDGELCFRAARGIEHNTIEQPEFQVSRGIIERVAREGTPLLTSNAQLDHSLSARQSVVILGLRSVLCVPLQIKGRILGVVYVDNRIQAGLFTQVELDLLTAIASSAAAAIENARLYQLAVEKGRMERELQMARQVQLSLLPAQLPTVPGWQFAAHWEAARTVGGDFYDFIPLENGRLGLMIGDVADKGMPAALFMGLTRTTLRASLHISRTPAESIAHANRLVCADAARGMFVTLFYAELDLASGELVYVNAGQNPPLLLRRDRAAPLLQLARTAMALGIDAEMPIRQECLQLLPGDLLLLFTDGLADAVGPQGDFFDLPRIITAAQGARAQDGTQAPAAPGEVGVVPALLQAVRAFAGDEPVADDITLLVVERQG